jgi:hypothetical protein
MISTRGATILPEKAHIVVVYAMTARKKTRLARALECNQFPTVACSERAIESRRVSGWVQEEVELNEVKKMR